MSSSSHSHREQCMGRIHQANGWRVTSSDMSVLTTLQAMGFSVEAAKEALAACGAADVEDLVNHILARQHESSLLGKEKHTDDEEDISASTDFDDINMDDDAGSPESDLGVEASPPEQEIHNSAKLVRMGFSYDAVMHAIRICGDTDYNILVDFIIANELERSDKEQLSSTNAEQSTKHFEGNSVGKVSEKMEKLVDEDIEDLWNEVYGSHDGGMSDLAESLSLDESESSGHKSVVVSEKRRSKKQKSAKHHTTLRKCTGAVVNSDASHKRNRMVGFGIPGFSVLPRKLNPLVEGPPYFYFENVATMPRKEWENISRHFGGIKPEFVDSKYFCACRRPRGYIHNLPVEGRQLILPEPPMSIQELFPRTVEFWPSWDPRTKLNCINTRLACDSICGRLRDLLCKYCGPDPPSDVKKHIIFQCRKWNLIWTGPGQPAPLEPHEIELCLGFDEDHTRGASNKTGRVQSLGNSFQIHTVAYHLSVLKPLFPLGMRVLSLFSGIGGAEVALHKLGIKLLYVVSVEINISNKIIVESWWRKSGQRGTWKHFENITDLTTSVLQGLLEEVGGFDLVIGGSPCNNLSGNNRVSRIGLSGADSCLFFEFTRVLEVVRKIMSDEKKREGR